MDRQGKGHIFFDNSKILPSVFTQYSELLL